MTDRPLRKREYTPNCVLAHDQFEQTSPYSCISTDKTTLTETLLHKRIV